MRLLSLEICKGKYLPKRPQTLLELREMMVGACNEITEEMSPTRRQQRVRVEECARRDGSHIEHKIF